MVSTAADAPGTVIHGGTLFDGSGSAPYRADIRIRDGRVVDIVRGRIAAGPDARLTRP